MSLLSAFLAVVAGGLMIFAPAIFIGPRPRRDDPAPWGGKRLRLGICGGVLIVIALASYAYVCAYPEKKSKDKDDEGDSAIVTPGAPRSKAFDSREDSPAHKLADMR